MKAQLQHAPRASPSPRSTTRTPGSARRSPRRSTRRLGAASSQDAADRVERCCSDRVPARACASSARLDVVRTIRRDRMSRGADAPGRRGGAGGPQRRRHPRPQGPAGRVRDRDRRQDQPRPAPCARVRERARRRRASARRRSTACSSAHGFLQRRVAAELRLKHTPTLDVRLRRHDRPRACASGAARRGARSGVTGRRPHAARDRVLDELRDGRPLRARHAREPRRRRARLARRRCSASCARSARTR